MAATMETDAATTKADTTPRGEGVVASLGG
jgi:hypothetical protein